MVLWKESWSMSSILKSVIHITNNTISGHLKPLLKLLPCKRIYKGRSMYLLEMLQMTATNDTQVTVTTPMQYHEFSFYANFLQVSMRNNNNNQINWARIQTIHSWCLLKNIPYIWYHSTYLQVSSSAAVKLGYAKTDQYLHHNHWDNQLSRALPASFDMHYNIGKKLRPTH